MKNTPADFEHAAELLAENTRLRAALAERTRQHEAALADIEKAQQDIGRLRIWHERAIEERDAAREALREACDMLATARFDRYADGGGCSPAEAQAVRDERAALCKKGGIE